MLDRPLSKITIPDQVLKCYLYVLNMNKLEQEKGGWLTCDFTSFSKVFQPYQDDGRAIIKGCMQWNTVYS